MTFSKPQEVREPECILLSNVYYYPVYTTIQGLTQYKAHSEKVNKRLLNSWIKF